MIWWFACNGQMEDMKLGFVKVCCILLNILGLNATSDHDDERGWQVTKVMEVVAVIECTPLATDGTSLLGAHFYMQTPAHNDCNDFQHWLRDGDTVLARGGDGGKRLIGLWPPVWNEIDQISVCVQVRPDKGVSSTTTKWSSRLGRASLKVKAPLVRP